MVSPVFLQADKRRWNVATALAAAFLCLSQPGSAFAQTPKVVPGAPIKALTAPVEKGEDAPTVSWIDSEQPVRVVLFCIHGLGLHKGSYEAFGKQMERYGIAVVAMDMRGFGEWLESGKHTEADFDGSLADIQVGLKKIHKTYPDVPVVVLGESMGGAIALRATALFPDQVAGLISSVPSGDRFNEMGQSMKVGVHAIFGGINKPLDIGSTIVKQATKKDDLRQEWSKDPAGKMMLSPSELMHFQKFMGENFDAAKTITNAPVLFIQGAGDKLVRPAGTWQLYDTLATANRQLAFSKNGEHLIFEDNQFTTDDMLYVRSWLNKNIAPLDPSAVAPVQAAGATVSTAVGPDRAVGVNDRPGTPSVTTRTAPPGEIPAAKITPSKPASAVVPPPSPGEILSDTAGQGVHYWIELYRGGKTYRCNNKVQFRSGDSIRFHVVADNDCYAYVVLKEGTTGKSAILFPSPESGTNNHFVRGHDYVLPNRSWLEFDNHPGTEKVSLVLSPIIVDVMPVISRQAVTAYVSPELNGSKDIVPTRMELSWDDPTPVIMPGDILGGGALGSSHNSSVHVRTHEGTGILSVEIALEHQ